MAAGAFTIYNKAKKKIGNGTCNLGASTWHIALFTSASNARFDQWLKARDPNSGVRNFEDLDPLAATAGMRLVQDYAMPMNNRTLVWTRLQ